MRPVQAYGFIIVIVNAAIISGIVSHYGVYDSAEISSAPHFAAIVSVLFIAIGGFLATSGGPRR